MANRIFNGDSVAEVRHNVQTHFDKLDQVIEALHQDVQADEYIRKSGTSQGVQQSVVGLSDITLAPPEGYGWVLDRVGIIVTPQVSAGATVSMFVDYVSLSSLVEFIGVFSNSAAPFNGSYYSDSFSNHIYVPDGGGSGLIIEWAGMPAGCNIGISVQGRVVKSGAPTRSPKSAFFGDA